jgi:hypothetical protein
MAHGAFSFKISGAIGLHSRNRNERDRERQEN